MADNPTTPVFSQTEIEMRQEEVNAYARNIAIYTQILATLDGNWDADLFQYKGQNFHDAAKQCPIERVERLAELQQYENVSGLIRTEILEKTKSQAILNAMLSA
jgi:hypothetical protein